MYNHVVAAVTVKRVVCYDIAVGTCQRRAMFIIYTHSLLTFMFARHIYDLSDQTYTASACFSLLDSRATLKRKEKLKKKNYLVFCCYILYYMHLRITSRVKSYVIWWNVRAGHVKPAAARLLLLQSAPRLTNY